MLRRQAAVLAVAAALALVASAPALHAEVYNLKVVTDANPDYTDIASMIHSITSNWQTDKEKCWAIWYWNKIGRRQTAPMHLHGTELTDPIRRSTTTGSRCAARWRG